MRKASLIILVLCAVALAYFGVRWLADDRAVAAGVMRCAHDGQAYVLGAQRRAPDGCNVCACGRTGWSCTRIFCPAGSETVGTISGALGTPGGSSPLQRVCAVNLQDDREYCQQTLEGDAMFAVSVPPGDYWVYARSVDPDAAKRAYYSRYETCGELPACKDHSPVTVSVTSGAIFRADPKDWNGLGQIDEVNVTPSKWEYGIHNYYPGASFVLKTRDLAHIALFFTPWPPRTDPPALPLGEARLQDTDHGVQTWLLPLPRGFEATTAYAIGSASDGEYLQSRTLRFVRPVDNARSTVE